MIVSEVRRVFHFARPLHLIFSALTYTLGASIARYLGMDFQWPAFWLGLLAVLALLPASSFLLEYFRLPLTPRLPGETSRQREHIRTLLLQLSYAALTLFGVTGLTLFLTRLINLSSAILLMLDLVLMISYAVPPTRLAENGYGELILAFVFATLLPAISFLLQADEFHRLLPLISFPLTLLALACLLASDFPAYAADQKMGYRSLLTRLTWQRAIPVHHILIIAAYLLFSLAPLTGIPWSLIWPVFMTLPFAIVEVFWLQRIAQGGRPLWRFFIPVTVVVFGLTVYLLALTFWIR
jgi:1,4-dihydroxy-2-naphthoate octaprenyltransferase